ncbi:uncharacterized protein LOC131844025 [Achroia grisella]|uniref:uncharacterized protein LOC131844025 n=1 Tax=Achroia grisella TaxID=688607 RepID=UPI0027D2D36E|nr:uncharacterized protein LOC131844025 [Achroia grisella]
MGGRAEPALPVDDLSKSEKDVLRDYYSASNYVVSPGGLLKVASVVTAAVATALLLNSRGCDAAPGLAASAASVALAAAALSALLYSGALLRLPLRAPQLWLYIDIILSTVLGVLLLVSAIMSLTTCELTRPVDYMHGPLTIVSASMLVGSAAVTYGAVSSRQHGLQSRR